MFKSKPAAEPIPEYGEIFDTRGRQYHEAMLRFPRARDAEFRQLLALADLRPGQVVCDYPSGGGYLERHIEPKIDLRLFETSQVFLQCARASSAQRFLVKDGILPLEDGEADRILSLAGVHHVADKRALFANIHRGLKKGGKLVLADAYTGSGVAGFLNEFVHAHSEEGHEGLFLEEAMRAELELSGFRITSWQPITYAWEFASVADMTECCRLMFGVTRADPARIERALRDYVGITERDGRQYMGWELLFIVAEK